MINSEKGLVEIRTDTRQEAYADLSCIVYSLIKKLVNEGINRDMAVGYVRSAVNDAIDFFECEKEV